MPFALVRLICRIQFLLVHFLSCVFDGCLFVLFVQGILLLHPFAILSFSVYLSRRSRYLFLLMFFIFSCIAIVIIINLTPQFISFLVWTIYLISMILSPIENFVIFAEKISRHHILDDIRLENMV